MPHAIQRPEVEASPLQKNMGGRGKNKGGRGGRMEPGRGGGRGRGGGPARGGGGGAGRGPGGGRGRGANQQQQQQQLQRSKAPAAPAFLRYLKQHLILKCFNYLDDKSRLNAFAVMGWPTTQYEKRKTALRQQIANQKLMKEKKLKEEEERKKKEEEEKKKTEEEEGEKKEECSLENNDCVDEKKGDGEVNGDEIEELAKEEVEAQLPAKDVEEPEKEEAEKKKLTDMELLTLGIREAWDGDKEKPKNEAEAEAKSGKEEEKEGANENDEPAANGAEKETKVSDGKEANGGGDLYGGELDAKLTAEEEAQVLPLLSAREDAHTLLDRLNSRRLYLRILHFKREQRKKMDELAEEIEDGEEEEVHGSIQGMFDGQVKEHDEIVKQKKTADRVYRKNMAIQDMAQLEWDELMLQANLRNAGKQMEYYPTPTQHELLMFTPCPRAVGVLASYPRSGNSLMRTMYEHTTLRVTGSDMQGGLAKHDLVGEMAVGTNLVQFVKTHFPERRGGAEFRASRVLLLVRNPFDAIDSFFNLMMTGQHTASVSKEVRAKTAKIFEQVVLKEIRVWIMFHDFWLNQDVPIMLIRYEDLIRKPEKVMSRVLQFVLEVKRMGSFFTDRIDRCIKEQAEVERMGSYKPRSGGIGKSMSKYPPELLKKLKANKDLKRIMGYLEYDDLLVKPPDRWDELKPLEHYATEYLPSWDGTKNKKVVMVNRGNLARGKNEVTHWQKIKNELNPCNCAECIAKRKQGASSNGEGAGSEEKQGANTEAKDQEKAGAEGCEGAEGGEGEQGVNPEVKE